MHDYGLSVLCKPTYAACKLSATLLHRFHVQELPHSARGPQRAAAGALDRRWRE